MPTDWTCRIDNGARTRLEVDMYYTICVRRGLAHYNLGLFATTSQAQRFARIMLKEPDWEIVRG